MKELILFLVSSLPVILLGRYIYKKDKEKEPIKLLIKLFLGGIVSCVLVIILGLILGLIFPIFLKDAATMNNLELIIYVFVGIALIEEFCKWLMTYTISYNDSNFDTIYDMIVYSVFVALGFAFFENLFYVYENGIMTGLLRAILSVPGHACDGVFMGYFLGLAKHKSLNNNESTNKYVFYSVLVPSIMHGIYDYCLFKGSDISLIVFAIFIIVIYIKTIKKIKKISSNDKKIKNTNNYCPNCGHKTSGNFCVSCGRKND